MQAIRRAGFILLFLSVTVFAAGKPMVDTTSYISHIKSKSNFALFASGKAAPIYLSSTDFPGVQRILKNFQADVKRVTNIEPAISMDKIPSGKQVILVGTLGKSPVIDQLVKENKLDVNGIQGKWDTYLVQVVEKPMKGVTRALVITGSDKRGTIYGMYDVSYQMGVSPLYYWADVPVKHRDAVYVEPGRHTAGEPKVKYRGIFINDEAPALSGWIHEKFGEKFNSEFYEKVFDLLLRMKGNYLWPAMWGSAFNEDDPMNPKLADELGIVMGTSHQEPMIRAQKEWDHRYKETWNYYTDAKKLQDFWREGITRNKNYESILTIGLRGANDTPMIRGGTKEQAMELLKEIVDAQRAMIKEVINPDASKVPQLWCPYKEVLDYYNSGFRVPDDVTILWTDDNWGNIRKLPKPTDAKRAGGYGIYYHFDYVGGPRNYKWLNVTQISHVWEQMHLAYEHGVDRIWIVNVGDIKPMEFPIEFFLDYAYNPDKWPLERLDDYTKLWAEKQFGPEHAAEIADIVSKYTKYNALRKPELLNYPNVNSYPFSLTNFKEAETLVKNFTNLGNDAQSLYDKMPAEYKDAFYQLVLYPTVASANVNELYLANAKNALYATQGRASTNDYAALVQKYFDKDAELANFYNTKMANGKWNHMMDQANIGYTSWQEPRGGDVIPKTKTIEVPGPAEMGVSIEGSSAWWPQEEREASLPEFNVYEEQSRFIDIFNRGKTPFDFTVKPDKSYIFLSASEGKVNKESRINVTVDWSSAPSGKTTVPIRITGNGKTVVVNAVVNKPSYDASNLNGFVEGNGYISMKADHYSKAVNTNGIEWKIIPDLGKYGSSVTTFPVTAPTQTPGGNSPHLEYNIHTFNEGIVKIKVSLAPPMDIYGKGGVSYGISIDDDQTKIINIPLDGRGEWDRTVANYVYESVSDHVLNSSGDHVVKFWMVDTGVVLQKLVVEVEGEAPQSYMGPPESAHQNVHTVVNIH